MTKTQIELSRLDAQWRAVADILRGDVDTEMAEIDSALRALAEDISAQSRAALAAVEEAASARLLATIPTQYVPGR
jgi:hypothetical protein